RDTPVGSGGAHARCTSTAPLVLLGGAVGADPRDEGAASCELGAGGMAAPPRCPRGALPLCEGCEGSPAATSSAPPSSVVVESASSTAEKRASSRSAKKSASISSAVA